MNKKITFLLLSLFSVCGLVSCNTDNSDVSDKIKNALASVKGNSHYVHVEQSVAIYKPEMADVIDLYNSYQFDYGYFYSDTERAYSTKTSAYFADLDKETHIPIKDTIREYTTDEELYFMNDDGTVYSEHVSIENEVYTLIPAHVDDTNGAYTPLIFESEFKNPFDYIVYRDIIENDDGTLSLINNKADFLAECYKTVGLNFIKENKIYLDNKGNISTIEFVIPDLVEYMLNDNGESIIHYTRTNTLTIEISGHETAELIHRTPYTNSNPELQQALDVLDGKTNYTYEKHYLEANGLLRDNIVGYFTPEVVFFHHHASEDDTHPYQKGDDYDYKAVYDVEANNYKAYEYTYKNNGYEWGVVMVSSSSPYILDKFEDIGPSFMNMDASIFKKTSDYTYEVEPYFLSTIGQYFDYGMYGVDSQAFETTTNKLKITLNEDNTIKVIEAGFNFDGEQFNVNFYLHSIGTTIIPDWINN